MPILNLADDVRLGATKADAIYVGGKRVWPWRPPDLWADGRDGFWWDFSDLSTMFQDANGTIPVTGVDQPVGLVLDKHLGLKRNEAIPEFQDLNFAKQQWARTSGFSFGEGYFEGGSPGGIYIRLQQSTSLPQGKAFEFEVTYTKTNPEPVRMHYLNTGSMGSVIAESSELEGVLRGTFFTAGDTDTLYFRNSEAGRVTVSKFDVREIPGHHLYQPTPTARSILKQDGFGKYYLQPDGVDDFYILSTPLAILPGIVGLATGKPVGGPASQAIISGGTSSYLQYASSTFTRQSGEGSGLPAKDRQSVLYIGDEPATTMMDSTGVIVSKIPTSYSLNARWLFTYFDTHTSARAAIPLYALIARTGPATATERRQLLRYLDSLLGEVSP